MFRRIISVSAFVALLAWSPWTAKCHGEETPDPLSREEITNRVRAGVDLLNRVYWSPTLNIWLDRPGDDVRGHYDGRRNPPWWPSANTVEVLLDFMKVTGSSEYAATVESLYDIHRDYRNKRPRMVAELKRRNQWSDADERRYQSLQQNAAQPPTTATEYYTEFRNEYLDDSGWWGVTWLKMYDRTQDAKYLATAKAIHAHMAKNWRPDKGGGVMWSEDADKLHPNAITNNLFLILSARLYQRAHEKPYLTWAEQTLEWLRSNALYDGIGVVDAPGHQGDYWSYNQGTFIGGLTALYQATDQQEYLDQAVKAADGALNRAGLTLPDGVIVEKLGTGGDACLFKGVFVRYLAQLRDVLNARKLHPAVAQNIDRCIRSSVTSLLKHSSKPDNLYSAEWHADASDQTRNFNTQASALAAMVAVLPDTQP
ncbi:glycoside hydrolase family 76 protein [Verrucomicrobiota bacterium sgz303538]